MGLARSADPWGRHLRARVQDGLVATAASARPTRTVNEEQDWASGCNLHAESLNKDREACACWQSQTGVIRINNI
ncbi:hypothetical protein EJB05_52363 [Eragrostis curvula]|uniref:Uncharacterized protein n=1 Tax=Eragrostis curvula TaxID=38414 RepID=A0A5J9ST16_9POAL|nr:hypothetical protein EJB05_52363 [Eragrostis curvula]